MTNYLSRNVGKQLFPHYSPAQRKKVLSKMIFILLAGIFITASLVMWILHAIKHFKLTNSVFTIDN